jgi:hypothetical protein
MSGLLAAAGRREGAAGGWPEHDGIIVMLGA